MAAEAARVLARWGTAENIPALLTALESQSVMVRWGVLDAIGYFPDNRTAEATAHHLVPAQDRQHASKALQMMGPKAEAAVAPSLTNKDVGVRLAACRVLKAIGTKASADALKQAASDSNTAVARAAEEALQAANGR
jgi:HEAT repeat protein